MQKIPISSCDVSSKYDLRLNKKIEEHHNDQVYVYSQRFYKRMGCLKTSIAKSVAYSTKSRPKNRLQ